MIHEVYSPFLLSPRYANRISHALAAYVINPNSIVCIYLQRNAAMFAAHLAVLKAGAACCFIDPEESDVDM